MNLIGICPVNRIEVVNCPKTPMPILYPWSSGLFFVVRIFLQMIVPKLCCITVRSCVMRCCLPVAAAPEPGQRSIIHSTSRACDTTLELQPSTA